MGGENTPLLSPWEPEVCLWGKVIGQLKRNGGEGAVRKKMAEHVSPLGRLLCLTLGLCVLVCTQEGKCVWCMCGDGPVAGPLRESGTHDGGWGGCLFRDAWMEWCVRACRVFVCARVCVWCAWTLSVWGWL